MNERIVIASFNEDTEWVKSLNIPYVIYCTSHIKKEGTIQLPNIAREASQYLHHIITNYKKNSFYDYEIFCQGSYQEHVPDFIEKIKSNEYKKYDFYPFKGFYKFGESNCDDVKAMKFYIEWFGGNSVDYYFTPGAFFSITKKRLLGRSLNYYENLYNKVISEPITSPWSIERLWQFLL